MQTCRHQNLVLLDPKGAKLRCRHCHLTIEREEMAEDFCPECHEVYGVKRSDFEQLEPENQGKILYACEKCGAVISR